MEITSDALAYWFLRLNGFLTMVNFIVHPEFRRDTHTDVDIVAARFPYRRENLRRPMEDSARLPLQTNRLLVLVTEVKLGLCDLNGPWTRNDSRNLHKLVSAIGFVEPRDARDAAVSLQSNGSFSTDTVHTSLMCLGERPNPRVAKRYPSVPQITWNEILEFIYTRFRRYSVEKAWTGQWDQDGVTLFRNALASATSQEFVQIIRVIEPLEQDVRGA